MEEMIKCLECGRELPESEFFMIKHKNRESTRCPYCKECMNKKRIEGHKKRKQRLVADCEQAVAAARDARLSDFEPRELIEHLANLGYIGKLYFTQVREINLEKFKTKK